MENATSPLYFRIQESLREQIAAGGLPVGARVPSESELAQQFGTTRTTVRQALAYLTFAGLIVRRAGIGTFVVKRQIEGRIKTERPRAFEEQVEQSGTRVDFRLIGFDMQPVPAGPAATLGVEAGTKLYRLRRVRLADGDVISYEDRWMLARIGEGIPASELMTLAAQTIVEKMLGARLGGVSVSVAAAAARGEIARILGVKSGSPVLVRSHHFLDEDGVVVLAGDSIYRGDKFRFTYHFGPDDW